MLRAISLTVSLWLVFLRAAPAYAHTMSDSTAVDRCGDMEVWDYTMNMCMPLAMPGMPMGMTMVHGNLFLAQSFVEKPRGENAFTAPNYVMIDTGHSVGDHHYLNADFMLTAERWTFPERGYPELLQIGETDHHGRPYLDHQHPHSSPLMGLTLSDTISLGTEKNHLKIFFAPRGESTDGPVAFMHRPTAEINPDAPLGHHIGQDAGHISSTVAGAELRVHNTTLEASAFHGREPEPTELNVPVGRLDSYAARLTQQWTAHCFGMVSMAYVKDPEPEHTTDHFYRYSASLYADHEDPWGGRIHRALIWGMTNGFDQASVLNSFAYEFARAKERHLFWGRLEVLQRTPAELEIAAANVQDENRGRWVEALTLGYTHQLKKWDDAELGLGASLTKDFLPSVYRQVYAGDPLSGKVFLELRGSGMWDY